MDTTLDGTVALITGAGKGFGLAIAEAFADRGAQLALNYRSSAAGCESVVERTGGQAIAVQADVSSEPDVQRLIQTTVERFGRIDILVNNAGILIVNDFTTSKVADWHTEIQTNVIGSMLVTKHALPHIPRQTTSRIINLSSHIQPGGWGKAPVYAGTKGFITTWTKSLAKELGPDGITVNAIGPGGIETDMNAGVFPDEASRQERLSRTPLRRMGKVQDVAAVAMFLASPSGGYVTGQLILTNGGAWM